MPMTVSYSYILVALSVFIGMSAAYAALDLAPRIAAASSWTRSAWLTGGSIAIGVGIWSMHYTGMLAFSLPVPVDYDWPTVLLSLLAGILAAGVSLFILSRKTTGVTQIMFAGVMVGLAIITVHNVGMRAMRMAAEYRYDLRLAGLAVILAILFSLIGLWSGFRFRDETSGRGWRKIAGALVVGAAISSLHYCAMAATTFLPSPPGREAPHMVHISTIGAIAIATATLVVQGLAILTSFVDRRSSSQTIEQLSSQLLRSHDQERRRIARDLHDDVGQDLYAVRLILGRLRDSAVRSTDRKLLSEAWEMTAASMEKLRTIAHVLYPPELETLGFRAAIVAYVDGFRERSGIHVELHIPTAMPPISRASESALLNVIRECLLNVVRHSGSRNVKILIQTELSQVSVEASDDGSGILPEILDRLRDDVKPGIGTASMFSRIEELGGRLEITSGHWGTSVKAVIPIRA
ncbi:MAG: MHYT domain-containing protein [Candidatus Acidiferrales bacterium]|jgi:NO-binding membrane sensor protein with MHYT domain